MSQCSFICKAIYGSMIPFLFALASLQIAQANAECGSCWNDGRTSEAVTSKTIIYWGIDKPFQNDLS